MGKTHRRAGNWMETRFKLGDPMYPEDRQFFDGRYRAKIRNGCQSYYREKIDPRSMKTLHWAEYGKWWKTTTKRCARHKAKIMVRLEAYEIMQIEWEMEQESWWYDEDDWYKDDSNWFDYSFSDEADDYRKLRRQEELDQLYVYDMYNYGIY